VAKPEAVLVVTTATDLLVALAVKVRALVMTATAHQDVLVVDLAAMILTAAPVEPAVWVPVMTATALAPAAPKVNHKEVMELVVTPMMTATQAVSRKTQPLARSWRRLAASSATRTWSKRVLRREVWVVTTTKLLTV